MFGNPLRALALGATCAALLAACDGPSRPPGGGDIEPDGWDESKADQTCGCGVGGTLDDDALLVGVNRNAQLARAFQPDTVDVPAAYRSHANRLRPLALGYFMELSDAAKAATGRTIRVGSAYRSFCTQCALFASYAAKFGDEQANTFSAHAGNSEHQLGTTMDIFSETGTFLGGTYDIPDTAPADPTLYLWLDAHAWEFGFMNSYPPNDADDGDRFASHTYAYTRYIPEPWHWRFVGKRAAELHHRLAAAAGMRFSTHELIDLLHDTDSDLGKQVHALLGELHFTLADLEAPHPDDVVALARAFADVHCSSATLGRDVGQGACVQVTRPACGADRCGWFACDRGAWTCMTVDVCTADVFANAACPLPPPPPSN